MNEILLLLAVAFGYYLGLKRSVKEDLKKLNTKIEVLKHGELKPGPIHRPSAQDISRLRQGPKKIAEEKAMTETLDAIPELRQAREAIKKYGKKIIL